MQYRLEEEAERVKIILEAVAKAEHIVDWAVCNDTSLEEAKNELFELWMNTFDSIHFGS